MNNAAFGKAMKNVRNHRDIKLFTTERRTNYLVSEPSYHTTKFFTGHLLAIEMKQKNKQKKTTEIQMNEPVYLALKVLELSEILRSEFWHDYVKAKYGEKSKFYHIINIKTDGIYKDIADNVEIRFDTSNYELDRPKGKNKKVIGLINDELGGKIMIKFIRLRAKTYSYLIDDCSKDKKSTWHKKVSHKKKT